MSIKYDKKHFWKEQAKALFFIDHIGINEISIIVNKARETVSRFLNECEGYHDEMEFRKQKSKEKRKEYQRQWDKENRWKYEVTTESLKREHETAVKILSGERF